MRFLIVGAGATGGYYGGRLAAAGGDVTFFVRPEREAALRASGLDILSPSAGDVKVMPRVMSRQTIGGLFDVIILAVKVFDLDPLLDDLSSVTKDHAAILPLMNGIAHVDRLTKRFGHQSVLGGVSHIGVTLDRPAVIRHLTDQKAISLGELDGSISERVSAIAAALARSGVEVHISGAIVAEMWEKWVRLSALAVVTCLLRGSVGEVASSRWGVDLAERVITEVAAIAAANAYPQPEIVLSSLRASLTRRSSPQTCSLYRDLQIPARVESDHVLADLWARGARHGLASPLLAAACTQLTLHNARMVGSLA